MIDLLTNDNELGRNQAVELFYNTLEITNVGEFNKWIGSVAYLLKENGTLPTTNLSLSLVGVSNGQFVPVEAKPRTTSLILDEQSLNLVKNLLDQQWFQEQLTKTQFYSGTSFKTVKFVTLENGVRVAIKIPTINSSGEMILARTKAIEMKCDTNGVAYPKSYLINGLIVQPAINVGEAYSGLRGYIDDIMFDKVIDAELPIDSFGDNYFFTAKFGMVLVDTH